MFSVSPENSAGSAALILVVLVVVDIEFSGGGTGLAEGCDERTVDKDAVVRKEVRAGGLVAGAARGAVVVMRVTVDRGFVTEVLGWEPEGGRDAMYLGEEGRDAGLTVYCHPKTLFEDEEVGVLSLVGGCVQGMITKFKGFWDDPVSSESSGAQKTFFGH